MDYFKKYTVNIHTINVVNNFTVNIYIVNAFSFQDSIVKVFVVDNTIVNNPNFPEKYLLNMNHDLSHRAVEIFQFAGDHKIGFVYLSSYASHPFEHLDVGILVLRSNVYRLELDEWL